MNATQRAQAQEEIARLRAARKRIQGNTAVTDNGTTQRRTTPDRTAVLGAPHIRKGEDPLSSRGYEYSRLAGLRLGILQPESCKTEIEVHRRLAEAMTGCSGWRHSRGAYVAPLDPAFLMDRRHSIIDNAYGRELKSMMFAGASGGDDPDQARWLTQKSGGNYVPDTQKVGGTTQSAVQQNLGGSLIPFPEMGPLIPLLRNANALMSAGVQVFPLPPSGRIAFPRQISPATVTHAGEGTKATETNIGTDQLVLQAKKLIAAIRTNNELIRFGGPVVEQMFRSDLTIGLGLQLDFDLLQAEGSDTISAGLIGYPGVTTFTPTTIGANGNTLAPQDVYTFEAQIAAHNGKFEGWIIRPELLAAMYGKRASVLGSGDQLGLFLFDVTRQMSDGKLLQWLGAYPVTQTPNVPANRSKGSATNLTALYGGQWSDYKIGLYGTIEIATADQGDNTFLQDQTLIRAILSADGGPQHPGVFGVADTLLASTVGS